jgi:hypothetical protein
MWDSLWTEWHWDMFSPNTSVYPASLTNCSTLIIIIIIIIHQPGLDVPSGLSPTPRN